MTRLEIMTALMAAEIAHKGSNYSWLSKKIKDMADEILADDEKYVQEVSLKEQDELYSSATMK